MPRQDVSFASCSLRVTARSTRARRTVFSGGASNLERPVPKLEIWCRLVYPAFLTTPCQNSMRSSSAPVTTASSARPIWAWPDLQVRVLERREVVGGAGVTEEFRSRLPQLDRGLHRQPAAAEGHPRPEIARTWTAPRRAPSQNFLPLPDGRYLLTGEGRTEGEIAKFSAKDASRYPSLTPRSAACPRYSAVSCSPHHPISAGRFRVRRARWASCGDRKEALASQPCRGVSAHAQSAGGMLDGWSSPIRSRRCSASTPSSAIWRALTPRFRLRAAASRVRRGQRQGRLWGHAIGGMGAITQAMAKPRVNTVPDRYWFRGARSSHRAGPRRGVALEDGTAVRARAVVANVNPGSFPGPGPQDGCRGRRPTDEGLEGRLRHVPDECRTVETRRFSLRCPAPATITRPASSWRRASPTWIRPTAIASAPAGAGADCRNGNSLGLDDSLAPPGGTSRACSASTSPRNLPTAPPGTGIARRLPT